MPPSKHPRKVTLKEQASLARLHVIEHRAWIENRRAAKYPAAEIERMCQREEIYEAIAKTLEYFERNEDFLRELILNTKKR